MTDHDRPTLHRDDELTTRLRALVAPPTDPAYWAGLESRILARVRQGREAAAWWALPERIYRIGLLAAGLTLIVAGSVSLRHRALETRMAYETILDSADDAPVFARRGLFDGERPDPLRASPAATPESSR
ncbi:MAG: hypothetical protein RLZZ467_75 [Gemmatimonadota bacterium]